MPPVHTVLLTAPDNSGSLSEYFVPSGYGVRYHCSCASGGPVHMAYLPGQSTWPAYFKNKPGEATVKNIDGKPPRTAKVSLIVCFSNCRVNYCSRKIKLLAPRRVLDYPTRFKNSFMFRPSLLSVPWFHILQWSGWRMLKQLWR